MLAGFQMTSELEENSEMIARMEVGTEQHPLEQIIILADAAEAEAGFLIGFVTFPQIGTQGQMVVSRIIKRDHFSARR